MLNIDLSDLGKLESSLGSHPGENGERVEGAEGSTITKRKTFIFVLIAIMFFCVGGSW